MDEQLRYAVTQMTTWVGRLGIVEVKRALAVCAEEAGRSEDASELVERLHQRAAAPPEGEPESDPPETRPPVGGKKKAAPAPEATEQDQAPTAE